MKPRELKKLLFQFLQNASDDNSEKDEAGKERTGDISSGGETLRNFIDGMSQQTARIIIEGEMEQGSIPDSFEIDRIENKGRYYLARFIGPDGRESQQMLIDKQTGNIQLARAA